MLIDTNYGHHMCLLIMGKGRGVDATNHDHFQQGQRHVVEKSEVFINTGQLLLDKPGENREGVE